MKKNIKSFCVVSLVTLLIIQGLSGQAWGDVATPTAKRGIWGWKSETRSRDTTEQAARDAAKKGGVNEADAKRAVHIYDKRGKLNRLTGGLLGTKSKIVTDENGNVIYRKDKGVFGGTYKERVYKTGQFDSGTRFELRVDKIRSLDPQYDHYEKQTLYKLGEGGEREKIQADHVKVWNSIGQDGKPIQTLEKTSDYGVRDSTGTQEKNSVSGESTRDSERSALWERSNKRLGISSAAAQTSGAGTGGSSPRPNGIAGRLGGRQNGGASRPSDVSRRATPFEEARAEARAAEDAFQAKGRELQRLRHEHEKSRVEATAANERVAQLQSTIDQKKLAASSAQKALNANSSAADRLSVASLREELADLNDQLSAAKSHAGAADAKAASAAKTVAQSEREHGALEVRRNEALHLQNVAQADERVVASNSQLESLKRTRQSRVQEHAGAVAAKTEELDQAQATLRNLKDDKSRKPKSEDSDLAKSRRERARALVLKKEAELVLLKEKHEKELGELDGVIGAAQREFDAARKERESLSGVPAQVPALPQPYILPSIQQQKAAAAAQAAAAGDGAPGPVPAGAVPAGAVPAGSSGESPRANFFRNLFSGGSKSLPRVPSKASLSPALQAVYAKFPTLGHEVEKARELILSHARNDANDPTVSQEFLDQKMKLIRDHLERDEVRNLPKGELKDAHEEALKYVDLARKEFHKGKKLSLAEREALVSDAINAFYDFLRVEVATTAMEAAAAQAAAGDGAPVPAQTGEKERAAVQIQSVFRGFRERKEQAVKAAAAAAPPALVPAPVPPRASAPVAVAEAAGDGAASAGAPAPAAAGTPSGDRAVPPAAGRSRNAQQKYRKVSDQRAASAALREQELSAVRAAVEAAKSRGLDGKAIGQAATAASNAFRAGVNERQAAGDGAPATAPAAITAPSLPQPYILPSIQQQKAAAAAAGGDGAPLPPSGSARESAATLATQKRDSQLAQEARLTAERNEARRAAARARAEQAQPEAAAGDGAPAAAPAPELRAIPVGEVQAQADDQTGNNQQKAMYRARRQAAQAAAAPVPELRAIPVGEVQAQADDQAGNTQQKAMYRARRQAAQAESVTGAGDGAPLPPSGSPRESAATLATQKRDSQLEQEARLTAERNEARRAAARARAEQAQPVEATAGDGAPLPPPAAPEKPATAVEAPDEGRRRLAQGNMAARSLLSRFKAKAAAQRKLGVVNADSDESSVVRPPSLEIPSHDGVRTALDSPLAQARPRLGSGSSDRSTEIGLSPSGLSMSSPGSPSPSRSRSGSVSPLSVFPAAPEPVKVKSTHEDPAAPALLKGAQEDQGKGQAHTSTAKNLVASGKFSDAIFEYSRADWYFSSAAIQVKHSSSSDSAARVEELEKQASRAKQLMTLATQNVIEQDERRHLVSSARGEAEQRITSMKDGDAQLIIAQGRQLVGAAAAQDALGDLRKAAENYAKAAIFYNAAAKKYAPASTERLVHEFQAKQAEAEVERILNQPKHPEP